MQTIKRNFLLIFTLVLLLTPFMASLSIFNSTTQEPRIKTLKSDPTSDVSSSKESLDNIGNIESRIDVQSQIFLEDIRKRLNSGEDPNATESTFIYWSDRVPDFPEWVEVQRVFSLIPVVQVSCTIQDIPNLEDIRYVDEIIPVAEGVLAKLSSFTQDKNPYVGEFPLLLNETHNLVDTDNIDTSGSGVIVAILSTGINENHPMLDDQDDDSTTTNDSKVIDSYDAYNDDKITDPIQHDRGTALASIVAGTGPCGGKYEASVPFSYPFPHETDPTYEIQESNFTINIGTQMGLAPGASLFDVKVTNNAGSLYTDASIIAGMEWAVDYGADVILLDDFPDATVTILAAIEAATSRGALVIVPAGDFDPPEGYDDDDIAPYYSINAPATAPSALTVGTTTETNAMWLQSERGPVPHTELSKPDVVAPGVYMFGASHSFATNEEQNDDPGYGWKGTDNDDTLYFDIFTGTAVSAAVAAGVSANLIESHPGVSPTAIKIALRQGATNLGFNEMAQGKGKVSFTGAKTVLDNAPKRANNRVGTPFTEQYTILPEMYKDFEGKTILVDGSWSTDTTGLDYHDWSKLTNGNLSTLGVASNWQHPYNDTVAGAYWYNVSFEGASTVSIHIDNLTLGTGDNLTIYQSTDPYDPNPTTQLPGGSFWDADITTTETRTSTGTYDNIFFVFTSDGDGATTGDPRYGIYGSIELGLYTSSHSPPPPLIPTGPFEFSDLITQLDALGATIEYWHPESAEAPPTSITLEYYDVYMLGQPLAAANNDSFNIPSDEAYYQWLSGNLTNYLNAGGRVLFIGDYEHQFYNYATNSLGVTWNYGGGGGPTTDFVTHPLTTTPFEIEEVLIDAPYAYFSGSAAPLVQESGKSTIMYYDQNNGKAVFVADEDVFNDDLWVNPFPTNLNPGRYNNSQLAMNIFYWLLNVTYQSGERGDGGDERFELASYECHSLMTDEDPWEIEVTVQNVGNFTSKAWVAFGLDYTPGVPELLINDTNDGIITSGEDNANDSWLLPPDNDIGVSLNDTTIEFFVNIYEDTPIEQIAMPYVEISATGMDRETAECYLLLNGAQLGPIYETNTSTGAPGTMYYPIHPATLLKQYNNTVEITIPFSVNLTLNSFRIWGFNLSNSLNSIRQAVTVDINPHQQATVSFQYTTPNITERTFFDPEIILMPYNMTHARESPGYASTLFEAYDISVDYYDSPPPGVFAIPKTARYGDLPLLYDISPGSLTSASSTKIVNFPGDIRVDGLTIMSSSIVEGPNLRLSGSIAAVAGLGNLTEARYGLGQYTDTEIAPDYFYINDTWTTTNQLYLEYLNHTSTGPILQVDIHPTQSPTTLSGTLSLYSNNTSVYSVSLQLEITAPDASFLLLDTTVIDDIDTDRDYDKLWDQLFEMWQIASKASYDVDSLYQEWYLYEHRTHDDLAANTDTFLDDHVCNVPPEEDLPYNGILAVDIDNNPAAYTSYVNNFMDRGGSLIQLGIGQLSNYDLGEDFDTDIAYTSENAEITSLVSGSGSTNPLLDDVNQLFYLGGGYMVVDQRTYDQQLTYDVISGQNWLASSVDKPNQELAVIYHDAIYPDRFGYDAGKYSSFYQAYEGLKIIVSSPSIAHSWFLEQTDYWAYASMKYAAEQNVIDEIFSVNLDNDKFIENIFTVASNEAPEIESINISSRHVAAGDNITVRVKASDDHTAKSDLVVTCPEKITGGFKWVKCTYNSSSDEYIGSFLVVDTNTINSWNIYVMDELYRVTAAVKSMKRYLIPEMNVKPTAWTTGWLGDTMPYSTVITVEKGDLVSLAFYYLDAEDGTAIKCNVSLYYHLNEENTTLIHSELFTGQGQGLFLIDTTDSKSGTYVIIANVTDSDGGTAELRLAGFNLGKGTLFKPRTEQPAGPDLGPVFGVGSILGVAAAGTGGFLLFLRRKGMSVREFFGRGE